MEAGLENQEWAQALRYAALLVEYVGSEPGPLTDLPVARTHALVAFTQGEREQGRIAELRRLAQEAQAHELMLAVQALEAAPSQHEV